MNNLFHTSSIIDEGAKIGSNTRVWHFVHICSGAKIGNDCSIGQNVFISNKVLIGNNVKIQNNVSVYDNVIIEDDVFCGPSMFFTNVINPRSAINRRGDYKKTKIGKGATIGANATIICGNDIGNYAFIGAGCVVTKAVNAYELFIGNPGRKIGYMSETGHRLNFDDNGIALCPETKEVYQIENKIVFKKNN